MLAVKMNKTPSGSVVEMNASRSAEPCRSANRGDGGTSRDEWSACFPCECWFHRTSCPSIGLDCEFGEALLGLTSFFVFPREAGWHSVTVVQRIDCPRELLSRNRNCLG